MKLHTVVNDIHMEETTTQMFDIGPSFDFIVKKTRRFRLIFHSLLSTFGKTKAGIYIKNLGHGSLHRPIYIYLGFANIVFIN